MLNVQLDLENLTAQFTESLRRKHQWQWKEHLLPTIEKVKKEFPEFDDDDIADRVGDNFIDWEAQEIQDDKDWEEAFQEVVTEASLNEQQKAEFRNFLTNEQQESELAT